MVFEVAMACSLSLPLVGEGLGGPGLLGLNGGPQPAPAAAAGHPTPRSAAKCVDDVLQRFDPPLERHKHGLLCSWGGADHPASTPGSGDVPPPRSPVLG